MALATFVTVAPWVARNVLVHKGFVMLDTKLGWNLFFFNQPRVEPHAGMQPDPQLELPAGYAPLKELDRDRVLRQRGIEFIWRDPQRFGARLLDHATEFWSPVSSPLTPPRGRNAGA